MARAMQCMLALIAGFYPQLSVLTTSSPVPLITLRATVGERVQLSCTTQFPVPVDWSYERSSMGIERKMIYADGMLVNGYRSKYLLDSSSAFTYNLIMRYASLGDSGIFTCTERGGVGDVLTRINLIVSRNLSFQMSPKGIVSMPEGSKLEFVCQTGLEAPVEFRFFPVASTASDFVYIFTDNRVINTFDGRVSVVTNSDEGTYKLSLGNLSPAMSGTIECVESGGHGPGRDRAEVVVNSAGHVSTDARPSYTTPVETTSGSLSESNNDVGVAKDVIIVIACVVVPLLVLFIAALLITKFCKAEFKKLLHLKADKRTKQSPVDPNKGHSKILLGDSNALGVNDFACAATTLEPGCHQ